MMGTKIVAALAGCVLSGAIWGCAEDTASAAPEPALTGEQLLSEMARAYQSAPAFTDEMRVELRVGAARQSDVRSVAAGPGATAQLEIDGFEFTAVDQKVFIVRSGRPGKYFVTPLVGNLPNTFGGLTGGMPLPVPQLALRFGRGPEDYLQSFGMQAAVNLKLAGLETVTREGRSLEQLQFTGDGGATVRALVDPETRFLERLELERVERNGSRMTMTASMSPKRLDRLPQPISFDPEGRRAVQTLQDVMKLGKGDTAPDFSLPTLDGDQVTLSDHRGSLVVVDFWATWCRPCRMGLPKLQQFGDWARQEGLAVEVIPVNIGERLPSNEAKKQAVGKFWKSQGFTMKTLMDYDNSTARAFEIGPIPHTVVVGPDGIIRHVEVGFRPALTDELKTMARKHNSSGSVP
ncbi:MAG: TlpA family protein disulfide reductase [Planctomycetota bacterium]|jgi:thiol-disulfide isomerase/thioredoxin